jgi:alpha-tubulin suppressor-like RCC1 family protein
VPRLRAIEALGRAALLLVLAGCTRITASGPTRSAPPEDPPSHPYVQVVASGHASCALRRDGAVFCWGAGADPSGEDARRRASTPAHVPRLGVARELELGPGAILARGADGSVRPVLMTSDHSGQAAGTRPCLITQSGRLRCAPEPVPADVASCAREECAEGWVTLPLPAPARAWASSEGLTCALIEGGRVLCSRWERRAGDALVDLGHERFRVPVAVDDVPGPAEEVAQLPHVEQLAVGEAHLCALTSAGEVACLGRAEEGQLGDGRRLRARIEPPIEVGHARDATALAAGDTFSCSLHDGRARCWGTLADSSSGSRPRPEGAWIDDLEDAVSITAGTAHACALRRTGGVVCWRSSLDGPPRAVPVDGVQHAVEVASAGHRTCARAESGEVLCWDGRDADAPELRREPALRGAEALVMGATPCALRRGAIDCVASFRPESLRRVTAGVGLTSGDCGLWRERGIACWYPITAPVPALERWGLAPIAGSDGATALSARRATGCAVQADGGVICWDGGEIESSPDGSMPAPESTAVAGAGPARSIALGGGHACALGVDGAVRCWGRWDLGQLGFSPDPARVDTWVRVGFPSP